MDDLMEEKLFGILDAIAERAETQKAEYRETRDRLQLGQLVAYCEVLHDFLDYFDIDENIRGRIGEKPEERYLK